MSTVPKPADWKTYDEFAYGIDANRLPRTGALAGGTEEVALTGGGAIRLAFEDGERVGWEADGVPWAGSGRDRYEAIRVADGAYFVDVDFASRPRQTLTLALIRRTGWALSVLSEIRDEEETEPGESRVTQDFRPGRLASGPEGGPIGPEPAPTRDLIGKRTLFRYSPQHLYEHIYLSSIRFTWQNIVGVQRGHADTERATTYRLDDELYLFTWRELKIPVASVLVFNLREKRSTGKFLGLTGDGRIENNPAGAIILPVDCTVTYPEGEEPV